MPRRSALSLALLSALGVYGVARALLLAWSCDDAFISYRYAENLVAGHGLVYNAGERVEGYTNPLWTLALAGFDALGVSPLRAATGLGIAAYVALAALLAAWSWRRARAVGGPFVPLAAALVLVLADMHTWATGGLETMLYTTLATAGLLATRGSPGRARAWVAGLLLALTVFTRLDGALFALAGVLSPWFTGETRGPRTKLRLSAAIAVPVLALNGAHLVWKLGYYGELLPTSFYAKSAADPYFSQGLLYLRLLVERNVFALPALAIALALSFLARDRERRLPASDELVFASSAALFLTYVAYTGGDFMYARRAVPALPLVFLVLEGLLARVRPAVALPVAAATLFAAAFPRSLYSPERPVIQGIADEPRFYTGERLAARRRQAEQVAEVFAGAPVRALFQGGMCCFGYYSRLPYLVEMTGLTQMSLARSALAERGTIGHEKSATPEWLVENGIHLVFAKEEQAPPPQRQFNELYIGDSTGVLVMLYDDAVMDPLRGRDDVSFVPIEDVLAQLAPLVESAPLPQAEQHFATLSMYYFRSGGPRARQIEAELQAVLDRRRQRGR